MPGPPPPQGLLKRRLPRVPPAPPAPARTSHPRPHAAPQSPRPGPTVTLRALPGDSTGHPSPQAGPARTAGEPRPPAGPTYPRGGTAHLPAGSSGQPSWRRGRRESGFTSGRSCEAEGEAAPDWLRAAGGGAGGGAFVRAAAAAAGCVGPCRTCRDSPSPPWW